MFSRFITCFKKEVELPVVKEVEVPVPMVINDKVINDKVINDKVINDKVINDKVINDKVIPTWKNTTPFVAPVSEGHVIKVYDGDTITIAGYLPYPESPLYRFSVRLNGIDTPEMKGKTEKEKADAILAKTELQNLILDKRVVLRNVQTEKYGRLLADVYIGDLNVNQHMLDTGMAVKYDGGTKAEFK